MIVQPAHLHQAFGLSIRSCLPLPELLPAPPEQPVDVDVVYGDIPRELPDALAHGLRYQSAMGALRLQVDGVATFLVRDGREIVIARASGADDDDVRVFLLGSALGALLHQRHDLVLHGSAIAWQGEAVIFVGLSGLGKSTLAAAFARTGCPMLTDDLCVVRPDAHGRMHAYPGFPQTKLWPDSLKQLDLAAEDLRPIRRQMEKRAMPLGGNFSPVPLPVRKIYVLRANNRGEFKQTPVDGPRKFNLLKGNTYRFGFLADPAGKTGHFQNALRLAQQSAVATLVRPRGGFRLEELVALVSADLRS